MRKSLIALLSACLSLSAAATTPGFTTITATNIVDASGAPLASGTVTFQVVDANARALSVQVAGGGQVVTAPVTVPVTGGAFTAQVVDVSQTAPSFPCVVVTITNNVDGSVVWQNKCLQPMGGIYDLDQFSANTTPIAPQAGDTVQGTLGVNGNLNVTGTLSVGGLNINTLNALISSGIVNASLYAGSDIGAKVNTAFAQCSDTAPCHVEVPPGNYSYATPILLPQHNTGLELTIDRAATLTYTGTGDAIGTQPMVNGFNSAGVLFDGGGKIVGTSAANSGLHIRAGQGYDIEGMTFTGFSSGDGIWIDGANVVTISGTLESFNVNGLRVTGNVCNASNQCNWDRNSSHTWVNAGVSSPLGFAPNAIQAKGNRFIQNKQWGILEGDVVGGSVSQAFNNSYEDNDLEGNGTQSSSYGAALTGYSVNTTFEGNYLEGDPRGVVVGCVLGDAGVASIPSGYNQQFCGNATNTVITRNFLNDSGTDEVFLAHAVGPKVNFNAKHGTSPCLVNSGVAVGAIAILDNQIDTGSATCTGGTAGGVLANFVEFGDSTAVARRFPGSVQVDNVLNVVTLLKAATNFPAMTGSAQIVAQIGSLTIWQSTVTPGGPCGSANTFNLWFAPTGMYECVGGSSTWKLVSAS